MTRPEKPCLRFQMGLSAALGDLLGGCLVLADVNEQEEAERLAQEYMELARRIRGNRGPNVPVTWADLKLWTENAVRFCLALLEKHP